MLEQVFSICGLLAMLGWAALVFLPGKPFAVNTFARLIVPGLIGVVYVALMLGNRELTPADGGFGSLAEVKALFQVDALLLAGWVHYLAFDLFVGSWEVSDARSRGMPHWLVLPCLAATLMAGPAGLLLYLLLRWIWQRFAAASPASAGSVS